MVVRISLLTVVLVGRFVTATPLAAQEPPSVLSGITSVSPILTLVWSRNLNIDSATVHRRLQTVFELELRKQHVRVTKDEYPFLLIKFIVSPAGDRGLIGYSSDMGVWEKGLPYRYLVQMIAQAVEDSEAKATDSVVSDLGTTFNAFLNLWAHDYGETFMQTWMGYGHLASVGEDGLRDALEKEVVQLAQHFANEWLKYNTP